MQNMTRHADSVKELPRALFDKMTAAKNFQSGLQMLAPDRVFIVRLALAQ